jgi:hypothetical protein
MKRMLQTLLLGPGLPDPIPRQGLKRAACLIYKEWFEQRNYAGLARMVRLGILSLSFAFPTVYLDSAADRVIRAYSRRSHLQYVDARIVAVYRDVFYTLRACFLLAVLFSGWYTATWVACLSGYFVLDIMHNISGGAFVWGRHSIHPARSVILAIFSYAQVTLAFAILYLHCGCLNEELHSATQAVYFSVVTAATVGFGELHPNDSGYVLVIWQIAVFVMFVLFTLATLISRVPGETRRRRVDVA